MPLHDYNITREWLIEHHINQSLTYQQMGNLMGVSRQRIEQCMKREGLKNARDKRPPKRGDHDCHSDIFDVIDTEEKAYWLGFVRERSFIKTTPPFHKAHQIVINAMNEEEHLERFRTFIGLDVPVKTSGQLEHKTLDFRNNKLAKVLLAQKEVVFFPEMNENLYRHYLRGYFESKGSIYFPNDLRILMRIEIRGEESFLQCLLSYLKSLDFNITSNVRKKFGEDSYMFLSSDRKFVMAIMEYMYYDAKVFMTSRYDIVKLAAGKYGGKEYV
jgi:hypothetical protein